VLCAMHYGHGLGAWRSVLRDGPPWAALAEVANLGGLAARLAPEPEPVFAPSLHPAPLAAGSAAGG
jgi:hypothetical protein